MNTVKAQDVTDLVLYWANRDGDLISNLKLQKLLYYAQAWYLVNFTVPLFDDLIEAWDFGPVIPNVYHEYKRFGCDPIKYHDEAGKEEKQFSKEQLEFLVEFYDVYIGIPAHTLVSISHNEKPWIEGYGRASKVIDVNTMQDFYTKKYEAENNN